MVVGGVLGNLLGAVLPSTAGVQLWRRSSLWSILAGTAVYLVLVNAVF